MVRLDAKLAIIMVSLISICKSQIMIEIQSPKDLVEKFPDSKIPASVSLFGNVPYGFYTSGKVHYYPDFNGCKAKYDFGLFNEGNSLDQYPIVLVDRGNCTFVTKTRNAQNMGAHAIVIIDSKEFEDVDDIYMADDGTGSDVVIPALLISKHNGQAIKKYIEGGSSSPIILSFKFDIRQTNTVEYNIFMSSDSEEIYQVLSEFRQFYDEIQKESNFKIHYVSFMSEYFEPGEEKEVPNCISSGFFCAMPRYDLGAKDGRIIVKENIRQKCIYNSYFKDKPQAQEYWNYMGNFYSGCIAKKNFTEECSAQVISDSKIDSLKIDECISSSFVSQLKGNNMYILKNELLEEDYDIKRNYNIQMLPTIVVNRKELHGSLTGFNLLEAICGGLKEKPDICITKVGFKNLNNAQSEGGDLSVVTIVLLVLLVVVLNVVIVYICKRYTVKKMHEKIDSSDMNGRISNVVTSYLALRDK